MFETILKIQSFLEREEISLSNGIHKHFVQTFLISSSLAVLNYGI